jgi:hypothetical protein
MPTADDRKAFVRDGNKIFKVQLARHRRVLACRFCHARKIKCSKTHPVCTNCVKAGLPCEYFDSMPKLVGAGPSPPLTSASDGSPGNTSPSSSSSFDDSIGEESEEHRRPGAVIASNPASGVEFTVDTVGPYQTADQACWPFRHGEESRSSSWLEELTKPFEAYRPPSTFTTILSNAQFQTSIDQDESPGEKGKSNANAISSLQTDHAGADFPRSPKSISSLTFSTASGSSRASSASSMSKSAVDRSLFVEFIPNLQSCLKLLDRYATSVHPIIPILDIPELINKCQSLHEDLRTGHDPDMSYLPLLFAVLYAATVSLYEDSNITNADPLIMTHLKIEIHRFVGAAEMCLSMIHFPRKPSLLGCTVAIILYSVCRNDCRTEDSSGLAVLIRVAQLMGLHKDPAGYRIHEIHERRMIWWYLVYLDTVSALSSGLAPLIQPEEFSTQFPGYRNDDNDQYIMFAISRFEWAQLSAKVMRTLHRNTVDQLLDQLRDEIKTFGRAMDLCVLNFQSKFSGSPFCKWAASYVSTLDCRLSILLDREMILRRLHLATNTSSVPDREPALTDFQNKITVRNAIRFLDNFRLYADPDHFVNFVWEIRKFQPLQAILILLGAYALEPDSDLEQCLKSAFDKLGYLGRKTTRLCIKRWESIGELWDSVYKEKSPAESTAAVTGDFDLVQFLDWVHESMALQLWDPVSGHYVP